MPTIYLENENLNHALQNYISRLQPFNTKSECILVTDAPGRTTSEAVFAAVNSPLYDCAAMDGIAVVSEKTKNAREVAPVTLIRGEDFVDIDTGDFILPPYDAVIMAEDIVREKNGGVTIRKAAASYQHVRAIGEDIVKGELLLPSNHKIRPVDIGALLSGGITRINVKAPPKIAVIPTGSELIEPGGEIKTGSIIESNSRMLEALIKEENCQPHRFSIVPDVPGELRKTFSQAACCDMILLCSGTSAGREDFTKKIIEEVGEVVTHGVAIKPGKPVILAIANGKPVIGVPGYPVSAYIVYKNLISPVIKSLLNIENEKSKTVQATLTKRLVSSLKHKEFVRVKLGKINGKFIATPLPRGAGAGMSLVRADGFCLIEQQLEGVEAGATVEISLLRELREFEKTVISIGSHDIIMDILADMLGGRVNLSSSHVGTMGGLMALKNKECHIAPIHYLDENDGSYNVNIIKKIFAGEKAALIKGVKRVQGIMVAKNNPLNINGIADLTRCRYVNRSRGTGTRMFLDYNMKLCGILPEEINGYNREVSTHMNVGGIICGGGADAGLGVMSAALACGLSFVPIGVEDYDFAIYASALENEHIQFFIRHLKSAEFHTKIKNLGGYTAANCGEVIIIE